MRPIAIYAEDKPDHMHYVQSITNVLTNHLGWHRARLKLIARFQAALLKLQTTNLSKIAVSLKGGVEIKSNYRRIQRFLSEYDVDFTALGGLLVHLLPQTGPYVAVLDRTEWHFGETPVNILVMGIAHEGIAFPVAWKVLPKGGGSGADSHIQVLERFLSIVDPESIQAVLADREFISVDWITRLKERKIPFAVRLRSNRRVGLSEDGPALPARMFARAVALGTEEVLKDRHLFGEDDKKVKTNVKTNVVVRRVASDEAEDPFLILATWNLDPAGASMLYRRRWEIETLFAALKSRGYDLEETHLTNPDRIQRLIGLLSLTFAWTHIIGEKRAMQEGPPPTKSHGRRERSLFRYGLDLLQSLLTTPEGQDATFFLCLSALRSPTAHLSQA